MKNTIRLWLIKIVLAFLIFMAAAILGSLTKGEGQSPSPIFGSLAGIAIIALLIWKPSKPTGEIVVKPLDKRDDDSSI